MINPLIALLGGIGFLLLVGFLFWPQSGLFWRLQTRGELTEKVLIEDTLKYIFKCERKGKQSAWKAWPGCCPSVWGMSQRSWP